MAQLLLTDVSEAVLSQLKEHAPLCISDLRPKKLSPFLPNSFPRTAMTLGPLWTRFTIV